MTELLSREKEFIKLNEQLDKLASVDAQQQQQQQQTAPSAGGGGGKGGETKFLTYTKVKAPNATLKKRGAGDGDDVLVSSYKSTNGGNNSVRTARGNGGGNKHAPHTTGTTSTVGSSVVTPLTIEETLITAVAAAANGENVRKETLSTCTTTTNASSSAGGSGGGGSVGARQGKYNTKPPDATSRNFTRTSNQRMPPSSTATFTVKYRNPKFVESPSLEVLVKDESATIRSRPSSLGDGSHHDVESVGSYTSSNTKRTQGGSSRKHFSTDGLIKFLKSKIVILEEDHDRISQEMTQQKELLEKTLERQKKVELQRDQAYAKHNALTEQLTKVECQLDEANRRVKERVVEQSSQQKELELVKREIKQLTQTNTNLEKRLYRANEELETAKNALTVMKNAERELRETMRVESEGKDKQIKSLKKQRADLLNAYKKQLFLIDNLKRQNICMEQSKMIGFSEKEFTKVLEWNTKT